MFNQFVTNRSPFVHLNFPRHLPNLKSANLSWEKTQIFSRSTPTTPSTWQLFDYPSLGAQFLISSTGISFSIALTRLTFPYSTQNLALFGDSPSLRASCEARSLHKALTPGLFSSAVGIRGSEVLFIHVLKISRVSRLNKNKWFLGKFVCLVSARSPGSGSGQDADS